MARIEWDAPGKKFFNTGVDRGVLYPYREWGYGWNGLTSVDLVDSDAGSNPLYYDGIKFLDKQKNQSLSGTISAFTYPEQLDALIGLTEYKKGLRIDGQRSRYFDMCYRTLVGNDTEGLDFGYKIHILYDVLAQAQPPASQTLDISTDVEPLSWKFTTRPISIRGHAVSSHIVIDSTVTDKFLIKTIEDRLYGKNGKPPILPSPEELMDLFDTYKPSGYGYGGYGRTTYGNGSEY